MSHPSSPRWLVGLAVEQVAAMIVQLRRNESRLIFANLVLIDIAVFIAWGRFGDYSLKPGRLRSGVPFG